MFTELHTDLRPHARCDSISVQTISRLIQLFTVHTNPHPSFSLYSPRSAWHLRVIGYEPWAREPKTAAVFDTCPSRELHPDPHLQPLIHIPPPQSSHFCPLFAQSSARLLQTPCHPNGSPNSKDRSTWAPKGCGCWVEDATCPALIASPSSAHTPHLKIWVDVLFC